MIVCGWCHGETAPGRCSLCGRDPAIPWLQRDQEPPVIDEAARHRKAIAEATAAIEAAGQKATIDRLAEQLDVDPRTVRRWRQVSA